MVKPTQPKGLKPKEEMPETHIPEIGVSKMTENTSIIVNIIITLIICTLFIGGNYFIVNSIIDSKLSNLPMMAGEKIEETLQERPQRGIILDLGEFILNLADPGSRRFLKVNVALELSKAAHDPFIDPNVTGFAAPKASAPDPFEQIEREMNQHRPAIRDAIISVLSSKTAEELSSLAGKELAKEHIKNAVNPLFSGEREVLRVSFGSFIIQ